jgi:cation-transporting ATPase 13A1
MYKIIDLEAKFEPILSNTAIYLLGLSQQVSTFTIKFQVIYFVEDVEFDPLTVSLIGSPVP